MKHEVLYQKRAAWLVGESKGEAATRRANALATSMPPVQYPNDYAGRVVSIRRSGRKGRGVSLRRMAGDLLQVAELDLTADDVLGLRNRTLKIGPGVLAPVRFDDRWGQVATTLRANFDDPAKAESEVDDETSLDGMRFAELSALAKSMLPKTVTETGTGNYFTKAVPTKVDDTQSGAPVGQVIALVTGGLGTADAFIGGYVTNVTRTETRAIVSHTDGEAELEGALGAWVDTDDLDIYDAWSTIQAAHDQLWTDQGSAVFTIPQIIRVFAGSYTENVVTATTLNPRQNFYLAFEANGSDSVTIDGSASYCILNGTGLGATRFDRLTFTTTGTGVYANASFFNARSWQFRDCVFNSAAGINMGGGRIGSLLVERTLFTGSLYAIRSEAHPFTVVDCVFQDSLAGIRCREFGGHVEGCVFDACGSGIDGDGQSYNGQPLSVRNCTFYACTTADINMGLSGLTRLVAMNNIHEDSTLVYSLPTTSELANVNRNCIHNATKVADLDGVGYATLADWQAFVGDQGNSPDANSIDTDPLLANPGTGDFSLQDASPCINTGYGSGVLTGQNGIDFDPHHPDIGAWSSGAVATHLVPILDSWANVGDGDSVSLAVSNVETFRTVHIFYRLAGSLTAFSESPTTRVGPGNVILAGLEDGSTYEVYAISSNGTSSDQPSLPSNSLSVTPSTVTAGAATALEGQGGLDLQLDDDCGDLEIVNLDLALVDGTVQVKQALCIALRMFRGEWFLDGNAGVPYYQDVLVKTPNLSEINSILKTEILKVENVNKILEFTSTFDSPNRELSVSFRVDTVFGPVTIEETL